MEIIDKFNKVEFYNGLKGGTGIAIAFIPFGFAIGLITSRYGVSNILSVFMSYLVYSGASQTLLLKIFSSKFDILSAIFAASMLNFRYVLINMPIYQSLEKNTRFTKSLVGVICTDETVAYLSIKKNKSFSFALGCNILGYLVFCTSSLIGVLLGNYIPPIIINSMSFALYGTFLSLLIVSLQIDLKNLKIVIITVILKLLFTYIYPFNSVNPSLKVAIILFLTSLIYAVISTKRGEFR